MGLTEGWRRDSRGRIEEAIHEQADADDAEKTAEADTDPRYADEPEQHHLPRSSGPAS